MMRGFARNIFLFLFCCACGTALAGSPPILVDKVVCTPGNTRITFALETRDPDKDSLTGWRFVTFPAKGLLTGTTFPDKVVYTPNKGVVGTDAFMISVGDTAGDGVGVCLVTIHVGLGDNAPPTASMTGPADGAEFPAGSDIPLTAHATDTNGSIKKVEFCAYNPDIGYKVLKSRNAAPFAYAWADVPEGDYEVFTRATDNNGFVTTSPRIHVKVGTPRVNTPAAITITRPQAGSIFTAPATVVVDADIQDDTGLRNVILARKKGNGGWANEFAFSKAPFRLEKTGLPAGTYTWKYTATDKDWAVSTAEVTITVKKGK